jgi:transcriptional regulator with XRE-family HTH domain
VARTPGRTRGPRPKQGARLLALRKAAGFTQIELAKLLDVSHANIAFWEWSDKPPRSEVLPAMARALGVSVEEILGERATLPRRAGPVGKLQKVFEQARSLPRREQELVAKFVATLVEQHRSA